MLHGFYLDLLGESHASELRQVQLRSILVEARASSQDVPHQQSCQVTF